MAIRSRKQLRLADGAGLVGGALLAPVTALVSFARHARMFHPRGVVYRAEVEASAKSGPAAQVAARLAGPALVRLSGALWKNKEWNDVLGCAVRFSELPLQERVRELDQDLLFATIRRPWTMALSPLTTQQRDYLANEYYAVSPFAVEELGRVEWRLVPRALSPLARTRDERLDLAVRAQRASLGLEWAPYRKPWQVLDESRFESLVEIHLIERVDVDQAALRFNPFQTGRGIVPVGFIHGLRLGAYGASQKARPNAHRRTSDSRSGEAGE